ncbi:MAG: single-stranded-DNA-specific exonuclease RecJ [archaeon]
MDIVNISKKYNLSLITSEILYSRGKNEEWKINKFLYNNLNHLHNPLLIPNIKDVAKQIQLHIDFGDLIYIFGDYDVDGVTASAILYKTLKKMGSNVKVLISDRKKGGYSLSKKEINIMSVADLIITVDCGINSHKEIEYAKKLDIDIIVIDHHECNNPPNCLYIDLKVNQGEYKFNKLSGAGITWKVCQYLIHDDLIDMLDLVALSTVADLVPLWEENRIIVKEGLCKIKNPGIKALMRLNGINELDTGKLGYIIAPCINAQGRLNHNQLSFKLLTEKDSIKVEEIAGKLIKINEKRKLIEENNLKIARQQINKKDNFIIVQGNFKAGMVGIIAGDLKEEFKKPVIVFGKPNNNNICKGSGRSISPLNILNTLKQVDELLMSYGGHQGALGCSIHVNHIKELKQRLNKITKGIKYDYIKYDIEINTNKINKKLINELKIFSPTGMGNPKPKFLIKDKITNIRTTRNKKHLQFKIGGIDCIAFQKGNETPKNKIIGSLEINNWRGKNKIQIKVKELL